MYNEDKRRVTFGPSWVGVPKPEKTDNTEKSEELEKSEDAEKPEELAEG